MKNEDNFMDVPMRCEVEGCSGLVETLIDGKHICAWHLHHIASPITPFMRREHHKKGYKTSNRKKVRTKYPKVKKDSRKLPEDVRNKIHSLYHDGWEVARIAKKLGIGWGTVKYNVSDDYRKQKLANSSKNIKRILADPIERKKQFKRVDDWARRRCREDPRYREWGRGMRRKAQKKYDATHREERRSKAIIRHNKKKSEHNNAKCCRWKMTVLMW